MELKDLCLWLRANSSGVYRPCNDAADTIERLSWALAMFLDGIQAHDFQGYTGLSEIDCQKISDIRDEATKITFGV